jgi:hypothetical protein
MRRAPMPDHCEGTELGFSRRLWGLQWGYSAASGALSGPSAVDYRRSRLSADRVVQR